MFRGIVGSVIAVFAALLLTVTPTHTNPVVAQHPRPVRAVNVITLSHADRERRLVSRGDTLADATPWRTFVATWYSGSGGSDGDNVTADGSHVRDNYTIAVDPNVVPLGSWVEIRFRDGTIHTYHADDTGGAIIGDRVDIYDSDRAQCFANGRQTVSLRIIRLGG